LIPTRDHTRTALCKNYRRSVNVQVVVRRRDRRVVAVGEAWPGNRNDSVVFRATVGPKMTKHSRLIGDGRYQGVEGVTPPRRGLDGRIVRDETWRRFRTRRATVEHVLAELKVWSVLRNRRCKGSGIDQSVRAVAALHNLRIEINATASGCATGWWYQPCPLGTYDSALRRRRSPRAARAGGGTSVRADDQRFVVRPC
jgi:hypothetical protein